jgi:hypothetical protein
MEKNNPYNGIPNLVYGFEEGAASPRESALLYGSNMVDEQNLLNKTHGGSKYYKKTFKKTRKMNGGQVPANQIEVPSFNPPGPKVSPYDANLSSKQGNQTFIDTLASGCNDCYVNNSCDKTPGCPSTVSGGSKRKSQKNKNIKNKPFSIEIERIKISPFKDLNSVKNTLKKWKKNKKSIGFTFKSSLKSMGLIPRTSGKYELGNKYNILKVTSNNIKKNKTQKNKHSRKYRYN